MKDTVLVRENPVPMTWISCERSVGIVSARFYYFGEGDADCG